MFVTFTVEKRDPWRYNKIKLKKKFEAIIFFIYLLLVFDLVSKFENL